jgi:mannose-1-phosphate guanylyltransferase
MILAAGLGTRLKPLTDLRAKPLVPVGDRPAIAHVLDRLRAAGVERVVLNAHHHVEQLRAFVQAEPTRAFVQAEPTRAFVQAEPTRVFGQAEPLRAMGPGHPRLALSEEPVLRGTAGGIAHARDLLGAGDVLLWNADILADVDVTALLAAHGGEATLVVQPRARGQGSVGTDEAGRVVRLRQALFGVEAQGGEFLGVHVLGAALRGALPERGGLIEDVYIPALARGATLRTVHFHGAWHDIGTVRRYIDANMAWLAARGVTRWVGPDARVAAGVVLDGAVVGAGASVAGQGALRRCVVWPGANVAAPRDDEVITA